MNRNEPPQKRKVLEGLEHCSGNGCRGCPYHNHESAHPCLFDCMRDAIVLLKEKEPKAAKTGSVGGFSCFVCGDCGVAITEGDRYCRYCGRKVRWT